MSSPRFWGCMILWLFIKMKLSAGAVLPFFFCCLSERLVMCNAYPYSGSEKLTKFFLRSEKKVSESSPRSSAFSDLRDFRGWRWTGKKNVPPMVWFGLTPMCMTNMHALCTCFEFPACLLLEPTNILVII